MPAIELFASQWGTFDHYLRKTRPHLLDGTASDFVFVSERGNPLDANEISHLFSGYRDAAGLPKDLRAHGLRHTFAQRLREAGVDLAIIQTLLGHDQESTTIRYAKLSLSFIKDRLLECRQRQRRESDAEA